MNGSYGGTVTPSDSTTTFHSAATLPISASIDPIDSSAPSYRVEHVIMGRMRGGYTSTYTRSIRLWSAVKSELFDKYNMSMYFVSNKQSIYAIVGYIYLSDKCKN